MGINSLITYIFASRSRPDKFFHVLNNIGSMSNSGNYEIIASLDSDDPTMNNDEVLNDMGCYTKLKWNYGDSKTKVEAINCVTQFINPETKIIINMSDDQEFTLKYFDVQVRNDMGRCFPDTDGVIHYPDQTPNGPRIMTMNIVGMKYFQRTGYIYHPEYKSVYCDNEEVERAKLLGKYFYSPVSLLAHRHWIFGAAKQDDLNKRNDSEEMYAHDHMVFLKRKSINFGI